MAVPRKFVRKEVRKPYSVGYIGFRARLLCDAHMAVPLLTRKVVKKQTGRRRFVCNIGLEVNMVCDVQMAVSFVKRRVVNTQFKRTLRGSYMRVKEKCHMPKEIGSHVRRKLVVSNVSELELLVMHNNQTGAGQRVDSYVRRGSRGCTLMAPSTGHSSYITANMFKKFAVHNVSVLELMIYNTGYLEMDRGKETSGVHSLGKGLLLGLDRTIKCGVSFGSFCVKGEEGSDSTSKASRYSTLGEYAEHGGNSAVPQHLEASSYVGIQNLGATCYMNSTLQSLYHIPLFRKIVYEGPPIVDGMASESVVSHLQALFFKLQRKCSTISTKELAKSLGWDTSAEEDVPEKTQFLLRKLEALLEGTKAEGKIQKLFEGHYTVTTKCVNVDQGGERRASFFDLQLDVKGCKDIYASFDKYVEVELLEGDNKYDAGRHGKQDAHQVTLFNDFPPVLQLHLKRFEHDKLARTQGKVNDHYEFQLQLDLDRNGGKYLSPPADNGVRNLYTLHSVIVHSGDIRGGHYYAFIRPTLSDKWFKFDDARVTEEDAKSALNEQYGGHETKFSNAYMLVYIRESEISKIFCNVDEKDLPQNLQVRVGKHRVENKHHFNEKKHKVSASSREKSKLHEKEKDDLGGLALLSKPFVYISRLQIRPSSLMEVNNAEKPSHVVLHIEHPTNGGPNYFVRVFLKYLRFDKMMDLLIIYTIFHGAFLAIDWLVETHLKNKLWISLSDGMAWFSILVVYLMVMRWRRRWHRSRMISVPDPFAGTPLPDVKKEDGIPVDKEEKDSILLDIIEKNEDSEMWLLLVHEFARVSFSWIKTSNEDLEKNEGQKEKKTIFLRSLKAHLAVMAIEVSGSYIVRRFLGAKGDAPMTDIIVIDE